MADTRFMWAHFISLGSNMWNEPGNTRHRERRSTPTGSARFLFDRASWNEHTELLAKCGANTLVIDIGEAMRFESHPEIAVEAAWGHDEMLAEIDRLHGLGFELIPKLNFSACHDVWLGEYSRMLSTSVYYKVCRDIIDEVCAVFKPRHFHIGMDEEDARNQARLDYCVVRQHDLWWHDLYYLVDCVERNNARPWVWADAGWSRPDTYLERMPKEVVQNNWVYSPRLEGEGLSPALLEHLEFFKKLDAAGFDQVPTGSAFETKDNLLALTKYCKKNISGERLLGMMQSTWERTDPAWMPLQREAAEAIAESRAWFYAG